MPSIEQREVSSDTIATLPAALEVFDKPRLSEVEENGKDSDDSVESFHLVLDEEEGVSNGQTTLPSAVETEDDILNKFDNLPEEPSAAIDPQDEDTILGESESVKEDEGREAASLRDNTNVNITCKFDDHYEDSGDGEFKSVYEVDSESKKSDKSLESEEKVVQKVNENKEVGEDGSGDSEKVDEPSTKKQLVEESSVQQEQVEDIQQVEESSAQQEQVEDVHISEAQTQPEQPPTEETETSSQDVTKPVEDVDMPEAQSQTEATSNEQSDNIDSAKEAPVKAPPEPKSEDDDADLLDVSMVRETEEDDACAIADALEDQEKRDETNEKSDEEQSDRTDAEQEGNDDNDNSVGFDDVDSNEANATVTESKEETVSKPAESEDSEKVVKPAETPVSDEKGQCESPKPCDSKNNEESVSDIVSEEQASMEVQTEDTTSDSNKTEQETEKDNDITTKPAVKRSHSLSEPASIEEDTSQAKKAKLSLDLDVEIPSNKIPIAAPQLQTLSGFAAFMKCRKLTSKLSRSDLEQFGLQKASECIMLRSSEGEFHQALRRYEKVIETMRKDMQQLMKQCKDLEIVNKKLMGEIRSQNGNKKPLVPLKITRSVGLQVRLNPGNELVNQARRRQPVPVTPPKTVLPPNRGKVPTVVRQVLQNGSAKTPAATTQTTATSPMLSQALQKRPVLTKRTTPVKKGSEITPQKPTAPGVIDLTDEDDKVGRSLGVGSTIKIVNKTVSPSVTPNKPANTAKTTPGVKTVANQQSKQTGPSPKPGVTTGTGKNNTLSPGLRLTPTSVITTSANGSPQMVYVVPTLASNAGGQQKVAFVNFQPTNGLTLNGSTMLANKPGQTLTLKTVSVRQKHPAPLPVVQRFNRDPKLKPLLPKPHLTIKKIDIGIILQWKMPYNLDLYENIASYQLYAYQETSAPPSTDMWRKVGDVKALALPMACTLTQFADKNKYYFAVRSVDVHKRIGAFSDPEEISL